MASLRDALNPSGSDLTKVLVALNVSEPDGACLLRLGRCGLAIERVVGSTVIGAIRRRQLAALRADEDVSDVEVSTKLRPH